MRSLFLLTFCLLPAVIAVTKNFALRGHFLCLNHNQNNNFTVNLNLYEKDSLGVLKDVGTPTEFSSTVDHPNYVDGVWKTEVQTDENSSNFVVSVKEDCTQQNQKVEHDMPICNSPQCNYDMHLTFV